MPAQHSVRVESGRRSASNARAVRWRPVRLFAVFAVMSLSSPKRTAAATALPSPAPGQACAVVPKGADPTDIIIEAMSVAGAGILLVAEFEGKPLVKVAKGLAFASSVAALAKKVLGSGQELSICTAVPSLSKALGSNKVKVLAPSPVAPQIASGHAPQGQTSNILRDLQRTRPLLGSALLPGQSTPPSVPAAGPIGPVPDRLQRFARSGGTPRLLWCFARRHGLG